MLSSPKSKNDPLELFVLPEYNQSIIHLQIRYLKYETWSYSQPPPTTDLGRR